MNFNKTIQMDEIKEKKLESLLDAYTQGCITVDSSTQWVEFNADIQNEKKKEKKQSLLNELLSSLKRFHSDTQTETNNLIKIVDEIKFPLRTDSRALYLGELTTASKVEYSNAISLLNSSNIKLPEVLRQIKDEKRNDLLFYVCDLIHSSGNLDRNVITDVNEIQSEYMKELNIEDKKNQIEANKIIMDMINIYLGNIVRNSFNKEKADEKIIGYKFKLFA